MKQIIFIIALALSIFPSRAGADLNEDFIAAVSKEDDSEAKRLLLKGADVNAKDRLGVTALMFAAINDNPHIVSLLINSGAKVNMADLTGFTALMFAADMGAQEDIVLLLLSKGADVNAKEGDGWTPLLLAARSQNRDTVDLLLEHGADVTGSSESGVTFFMAAASGGLEDIALELVEKGANVNQKTEDGFTALMYAAEMGLADLADILIKKGASVNAKDKNGNSVLAYALANNNKTLSQKLRIAGARPAFGSGENSLYCKKVTSDLANMAAANEVYFADNGKYVVLGDGANLPEWKSSQAVSLRLKGDNKKYFVASASHSKCVNKENKIIVYIWDSAGGGLQ